jgi:hypothetical protein
LISICNTQAKGATVTKVQSQCFGDKPNFDDKALFVDRIGNTLQLDAQIMYMGLVEIAASRNMKVVDFISKISNTLPEDSSANAQ